MDLVRFPQRRRKWLILMAAVLGVSGYGVYRVYNSPCTKRLTKLFELVIDSAETISMVSRDLKEFLISDSDQIPNSLKQLAKISKSKEFTDSLARVSESVAVGAFRGYNLDQKSRNLESLESNSSVGERFFSEEGTGFVSVVVGSFAKNLVLGLETNTTKHKWMSLFSDDKCREVLASCIERFTTSAVSVYIEKTVGINTYDQIFAGLTNPKHCDRARDVLVCVCNGALETFMRTSHHQVYTEKKSVNGWAEALTTTLAVPNNRKFMFDVSGRVTLETMRSVIEFVILKTSQSFKRSIDVVHEEVTERGRQVVGYVGAKSSVIITVCLAVYLHIVNICVRGSPVYLNHRF